MPSATVSSRFPSERPQPSFDTQTAEAPLNAQAISTLGSLERGTHPISSRSLKPILSAKRAEFASTRITVREGRGAPNRRAPRPRGFTLRQPRHITKKNVTPTTDHASFQIWPNGIPRRRRRMGGYLTRLLGRLVGHAYGMKNDEASQSILF